jgi:uncharacterized protein with gpF-like domain
MAHRAAQPGWQRADDGGQDADGRQVVARAPAVEVDIAELFQNARWVREFRLGIKPDLENAAGAAGKAVADAVMPAFVYNPAEAAAVNMIRARAQRFAVEVNKTTYQALQGSLAEGMKSGEGMKGLAQRVTDVMADRIRSSAGTIARTETHGAWEAGSLLAAQQTGLDLVKVWYSALDDAVRPSHVALHGTPAGLDEDFEVGDCSGPGPGMTGCPEEDINERCVLVYEERAAGEGEGEP